MKKVKKLLAMIMAMTMVLGLGLTSFAANQTATIIVKGLADSGENSVKYVKILEPDISAASGYKYVDGIQITGYTTAEELLDALNSSDNTIKSNALKAISEAELDYNGEMNTETIEGQASASVDAGLYAVWATNTQPEGSNISITYTNPMIVSVGYKNAALQNDGSYEYDTDISSGNNAVVAKYTTIPITKTGVDADKDNSVGISEEVEYTITTYVPSHVDTFKVVDTLTGATYIQNSVKVTVNDVAVQSPDVTFDSEKNTMTVTLNGYVGDNDSYAGQKVVITYKVTVTGEMVNNSATIDDGSHTYVPSTTEFKTGAIKLTKTGADDNNDSQADVLENAGFVIFKKVTVDGAEKEMYLKETRDEVANTYTREWVDTQSNATVFYTNAEGVLQINGLDKETYYFREVVAPEGYSINEKPSSATITDENLASRNEKGEIVVANPAFTTMTDTKLASLPSTGGIGTTIFTIGGCAIMIAAAALYFASKRKSEEN